MPKGKKEVVKVQVVFSKNQMDLLRSYGNFFGEGDAEIVRSIVTNWLVENKIGGKDGK